MIDYKATRSEADKIQDPTTKHKDANKKIENAQIDKIKDMTEEQLVTEAKDLQSNYFVKSKINTALPKKKAKIWDRKIEVIQIQRDVTLKRILELKDATKEAK